jgi:hypothetical protein
MRCAGSNLPQRGGAGFLNFRVRRLVLERQHVVGGEANDRLGGDCAGQLAQRTGHREQFVHRAVITDHDHKRVRGGALQQRIKESFARGSESGDTRPPRASLDPGYGTQKCRGFFHVRKNFTDERENHVIDFSSAATARHRSCVAVAHPGLDPRLTQRSPLRGSAGQNSRCSRSPGTVTGPRTRL